MGIQLREKKNKDNTTTLYFDIYHNGKRKYEFLQQLKLVTKPSNPVDRQKNKETEALAKKILANRQQELESNDYDVIPKFKQSVDFKEFFYLNSKKYLPPLKESQNILKETNIVKFENEFYSVK